MKPNVSCIEILISDNENETICVYCGIHLSDIDEDETCICDTCWKKYYKPKGKQQ